MTKFKNTPPEIIIAKHGGSISLDYYNKILKKYPEYFKKEIQEKKEWENIPKQTHRNYMEAYLKMRQHVINKTIPENIFRPKENHGIFWQIKNADKLSEYNKYIKLAEKKITLKDKMLRKKFYGKFIKNTNL